MSSSKLPSSRSVLILAGIRLALATLAILYILVVSPRMLLLGPLGHFVQNFLPGSSNFNLLIPAMISELVTDTLLIIGIMKRWLVCLLPWLLFNIMLILGIGVSIMYLLSSVLLTDTKHSTLEDVRDLLIVVILNSFLTTNIIHLTSALQAFIQLKRSDQIKCLEHSLQEHQTSLLKNESEYEGGVHNTKDIKPEFNMKSHDSTFDSVNYEDLP